ncbi:MAG: LysM peptidoglycan-binding domain-containing protein [Egibacteraceae bacterium]
MNVRQRALASCQLAAVLGLALGAVVFLHRLGSVHYFEVDWTDLSNWLATTPAEDVLVAAVRLLALACAWWLLASTSLYTLARLSRVPAALRAVEWAALPPVRRVADRAIAVTLVGSTVLGGAGTAVAAERDGFDVTMPTAVVLSVDDENPGAGHEEADPGYRPTPAGEGPGSVTQSEPSPFRLPLPEAPTAVGPPPATDLPSESAEPEPAASVQSPPGQPELSQPTPAEPTPASERGTQQESASARDRETTPGTSQRAAAHTVVRGDSIWTIAHDTLTAAWSRPPSTDEVARYWREVVASNAASLRSGDPDLIYPGEVVHLPDVPTPEE